MDNCPKCDKPFNNKPSFDRHLRYCGSRVRRRQRSCQRCAATKTKCDFGTPCSRCSRKGFECTYAAFATSKATTARLSTEATGTSDAPGILPGIPPNEFSAQVVAPQEVDFLSAFEFNDLPTIAEDVSTCDLLVPQTAHGLSLFNTRFDSQHETLTDVSSNLCNGQNLIDPIWCKWAQQGLCLAVVAGNHTVVRNATQNAHSVQSAAYHSSEVVIQSLRAFPTMMLRKETWPWLIHRQSYILSGLNPTVLPKALSACMGIAQMYVLGSVETRPFLWQAVTTECDGFAETVHVMTQFELLAAIQACMIYLVMCIIEGLSENDTVGSKLLHLLSDLYLVNKSVYGHGSHQPELISPSPDWASWIFAESQRRLSNLWLLIGCVVRVRTNSAHDPFETHRTIPLSGPRSLWEASSEPAWRAEHDASRILQINGLVYLGDLIDAQQSTNKPTSARKLDLWNASVDNLGFLMNLVHKMV